VARTTYEGAQRYVPDTDDLDELRGAVDGCRGCNLYEDATQGVFGAGPRSARAVLVGEQPGDSEDRRGEPFVGPAGRLLDRALDEAGIDRDDAYVTNAVKHFKFRTSGPGKRRIHATPDAAQMTACRPWLVAEMALLRPRVVVALGATAAKAMFGPSFRVTQERGRLVPWPESARHAEDFAGQDGLATATVHPSAVLRSDDRDAAFAGLVADLRVVADALRGER
jgi:uracil-DNA glycosylase family protein